MPHERWTKSLITIQPYLEDSFIASNNMISVYRCCLSSTQVCTRSVTQGHERDSHQTEGLSEESERCLINSKSLLYQVSCPVRLPARPRFDS